MKTTEVSPVFLWIALLCLLAWPSNATNSYDRSRPLKFGADGSLRLPFDANAQSIRKRQQVLPKTVYRGSSQSPEQIRAAGGFLPRTENEPISNATFSLQKHHVGGHGTAYSSTTRSFAVAFLYAIKSTRAGWVYKIHATPNMIDLDKSGFKLTWGLEEEFSAMGGILYNQIECWMEVKGRSFRTKEAIEFSKKYGTIELYKQDHPDLKCINNSDYNRNYDELSPSPGKPQLAGDETNKEKFNETSLEGYAIKFMEKNGGPVGWDGKFPLSQSKTGNTSL
ncbi:hypothetical protein QQS21_010236 [Conoideocrella luteorostrata]|uniref:Uncharacterized protein n=1 Tax=Conoideocrella luteorostrata TaxID=1105319 RepID=A0AAJ0CFP4_9HYPO|nr:hypothetical protein QQS21_010236 [Conoideocrella luteorostrata]